MSNWLQRIVESRTPVVWGDNIVLDFAKELPTEGKIGIIYVVKGDRYIWDDVNGEFLIIASLRWYNSTRKLELNNRKWSDENNDFNG